MAVKAGATVFTNTYPNQAGRVQASQTFDGYLGAPWAETVQKIYWPEFGYQVNINQNQPVGNMNAAGIDMVMCLKPGRTMTAAEFNNLTNMLALWQANGINPVCCLWNEANGNGSSGDFASGAAYTAYVNYYIPAIRAAGLKHAYIPALYTPGNIKTWYPGDANVDLILVDYYFQDFINKNAQLWDVIALAAGHSGGPVPLGLGEWGLVNGPKFPSVTKFELWAISQIQVPLLTYVNLGGTLDRIMWYDAGVGANQINPQTPSSQITTMLNVVNTLANAQPVGQIGTGPDYPDFFTPQANADAIANTGAPLLALAGSVLADPLLNIPGGTSVGIPNIPIQQLGYEIQISATIPNAATIPFVVADLSWVDSTSGLSVAEEQWILPCAATGAFNTFNGKGPTKGTQLTITFTNLDPAQTATVTMTMLANSRISTRDRWIQTVSNAVPAFGISGGRPFSDVIASWSNQTVPPGPGTSVLLPLYAGDVSFYIDQVGVSAASIVTKLQVAPTSRFGTASFWSGSPSGGTGSGIFQTMRWPRAPVLLTVVNNGAVNATVNVKAIALDETH